MEKKLKRYRVQYQYNYGDPRWSGIVKAESKAAAAAIIEQRRIGNYAMRVIEV